MFLPYFVAGMWLDIAFTRSDRFSALALDRASVRSWGVANLVFEEIFGHGIFSSEVCEIWLLLSCATVPSTRILATVSRGILLSLCVDVPPLLTHGCRHFALEVFGDFVAMNT